MSSALKDRRIAHLPIPIDIVPKEAKTLVLDQDLSTRAHLLDMAEKAGLGLCMEEVSSIADMKEMLAHSDFDLILLDFQLPDGNGLDALKLIAEASRNRFCASIMIASDPHAQIAVTALKHGCSDYLLKSDLAPVTLRRAVINAFQKAKLHRKIHEAGSVLVRLQTALKRHAQLSSLEIRPLVEATLAQVSAVSMVNDAQMVLGARRETEQLALTCRNMLLFCDEIERNAHSIELSDQ